MAESRPGTGAPPHFPIFDEAWLARYVRTAARLKERDESEVSALVQTAHQTLYRMVAFNLDGTLTVSGGTELDESMVSIVADLLRRSVPVIMITGRGRGGAREAAEQLRRRSGLSSDDLRRLSCVTHNGVFWLRTPRERPAAFLEAEEVISPAWDRDSVRPEVQKVLDRLGVANSRVTDEPQTLRIELDPQDLDRVRSTLCEELPHDDQIHVSSGIYGSTGGVEIGTAQKGRAIQQIATELGISTDQILRIGDQGGEGGNDFEFLASAAGFSVGTFSSSKDGCLPVLDDQLEHQLRGAAASRVLLGRVLLLPSLALTPSEPRPALLALGDFGRRAELQARREQRWVNDRFRLRVAELQAEHRDPLVELEHVALADVFDPRSGAVRFRDWEIELLPVDGPAQQLFDFPRLDPGRTDSPRSRWSMYTDTAIIARGPLYWFGETQDLTDAPFDRWIDAVMTFLSNAHELLEDLAGRDFSFARLKLVAAVQDNVRNFLLQLMWMLLKECGDGAPPRAAMAFGRLSSHSASQLELLFDADREWADVLSRYGEELTPIVELFGAVASKQPQLDESTKLFKTRECDHFVENLMAVQIGMRKVRASQRLTNEVPLLCVGLANGGTELPALAVADGIRRGYRVVPAALHVSRYSSDAERIRGGGPKYLEGVRSRLRDLIALGSPSEPIEPRMSTIVMDDNCTTCTTLELARDILAVGGHDARGAVIVRMPGINRQVQMGMPDHGFPDPDILFGFIRGLVSPSPYARLIRPVFEDKPRKYLDELEIFNKSETRLRGFLRKNGTPVRA
jgi:hydroxymethylpyrimidine pyrophosphatase-like HAD family hydrolase